MYEFFDSAEADLRYPFPMPGIDVVPEGELGTVEGRQDGTYHELQAVHNASQPHTGLHRGSYWPMGLPNHSLTGQPVASQGYR
ncbi:MAG: hypothetical protein KZQ73_05260 [Candidatus Thiodiazotropha sp. (ex Semelilucina semeliformis)]|nr:hypothetical protein [Candidatus Thiodiazotropha sp. (ex Semelilucina semeliformis)]MCU7827726.1 hypothetical protein [Candidatus Thiodiazotropha sp. (ex Myrtea sp. 'scaly one' KF741663)]